MAYTLKTQMNNDNVQVFLNSIEVHQKKEDSFVLLEMLERLSWYKAQMWWKNIVGFWSYDYTYASWHSWSCARVSFSPRASYISLYIMPGYEFENMPELMENLWKYKVWKCCLNIKKLSDLDLKILEEIISLGLKNMIERYPE